MNEHIEEIAKYFISLKPKRMGAVLLPSINGFDVYEFDEDSLRVIIHLLGKNSEIKAATRDKASRVGKEGSK